MTALAPLLPHLPLSKSKTKKLKKKKNLKTHKEPKALHVETGALLLIVHVTFTWMDLARGVLEPSPPTYQTQALRGAEEKQEEFKCLIFFKLTFLVTESRLFQQ